jgi:hypothetical protein
MDSSKIVQGNICHEFAALSSNQVDLVVTDAGVDELPTADHCENDVEAFCSFAAQHGVAVAVLRPTTGG